MATRAFAESQYGIKLGQKAVVTLPTGVSTFADAIPDAINAILRSRADKHCILVVDGDSTTNGLAAAGAPIYPSGSDLLNAATIIGEQLRGAGVHVNRTRWCGQMSQQSLGSSNGKTDSRVTLGSGVTETLNQSVVGGAWWSITSTGKLSFVCDEPVDTCRVLYITNGASTPGTMSVDIGGSDIYTVSQNVAASTVLSPEVALGGPDFHTINIGGTGGSVFVIGVLAWNSRRPGVTIINNGGSGKSMLQAQASGGFNCKALYAALNTASSPAALVFASLILNSLGDASYATNAANLASAITSAGSDLIFFDGPQPATAQTNSANYPTRVTQAKSAADTAGAPYISCTDYLGANPGSGNTNYIADNVGHCTPLGYAKLYAAVAKPLVDSLLTV